MLDRITVGGQTWAHRVRMFLQVLKTAALLGLIISLLFLLCSLRSEGPEVFLGSWYHLKARIFGLFTNHVQVDPHFWKTISSTSCDGRLATSLVRCQTEPLYQRFWGILDHHLLRSSKVFGGAFWCTLAVFLVRGIYLRRRKYLSGGSLIHPRLLALRLRLRRRASRISLGSLPLVKGSETSHILVTGGTGSGKTNLLNSLLTQVHHQSGRAVVVDTTGDFVRRFRRPGDTVLNPFSEEGAHWQPWSECRDGFDRKALAESLIPVSHNEREDYWRRAARTLFACVLEATQDSEKISELNRWLHRESLSNLCSFVQGTPAASFLDLSSEKTAGSIRSVASSFLECLETLSDTTSSFSIRDWISSNERSWLFLQCTAAQRAVLKPLLSCWLSIAVRALMTLGEDRARRLWFVIDELPSLDRVSDLPQLLSESRKYGGCALLALQSPAQLDAIYGHEVAQTIIGNCATRVAFAERDPQIAARISRSFGEAEVSDIQEGISYGAHRMRDGVSLSRVFRNRPVVSSSQIQSLRLNEAVVRLAYQSRASKIRLPIATPCRG